MNRKEFHSLIGYVKKTWSPPVVDPSTLVRHDEHVRHAVLAWISLSDDILPDLRLPDCYKWLRNISQVSMLDLLSDCKDAALVFATDAVSHISAFKGREWKTNVRKTFSLVWPQIELRLRSQAGVESLYQWFRFLIKIPIDLESQESEALAKWLSVEDHLRETTVRVTEREINMFSRPFKRRPDLSHFRPKHGNGAVAEVGAMTWYEKYLCMGPLPHLPGVMASKWVYPCVDDAAQLTSRLLFVPKTVFTRRAVAMEPAALMWYQQGWGQEMYDLIERAYPSTIHFTDQRYNQRLAREASAYGQYATIDLSSASDTVSYELVSQLSRDCHPLWRAILLGGRSTHCLLPDGEVVPLLKYAPMGSRFSFPIETLVFASVIGTIMEEAFGTFPSAPETLVYGDDCIVPVEVAPAVMARFEQLGFIVNRDKSYWTGPFRESCGADCYRGSVITPLYYRIAWEDIKGPNYSGLIDFSNHCLLRGYSRLREFILQCIPKHKMCWSDPMDHDGTLWTENPYTNRYRLSDLGYLEAMTIAPKYSAPSRAAVHSERMLQDWLRIREYTEPECMPDFSSIGRRQIYPSRGWITIDPFRPEGDGKY